MQSQRIEDVQQELNILTGNKRQFSLSSPYLFIIPAFVIYAIFFLIPTLKLVEMSLYKWDGIRPRTFAGLGNYERLFGDQRFWVALQHNFFWMIAAVIVPVLVGLLLAVMLSRSPMYGRVFFRTIFFMPQVFSSITVAIIWGWIYNPTFGALNTFLGGIGLEHLQHGWLGDSNLVLPALFIAWSWVQYGFTMVIFIAAIDNIDETYFDAAKVDGANLWQQFRFILFPFIRGALTTIILVIAISSFQVFDMVFVLTNGGPGQASMLVPIYMIERAFTTHKVGYGTTIAIALGVVILVLSVIFLFFRGVYKEADE